MEIQWLYTNLSQKPIKTRSKVPFLFIFTASFGHTHGLSGCDLRLFFSFVVISSARVTDWVLLSRCLVSDSGGPAILFQLAASYDKGRNDTEIEGKIKCKNINKIVDR